MNWYAVHTLARQEDHAASRLWKHFPVFLPRRWVTIRHARRATSELRPVLPRYLFVRSDRDEVGKVNRTPGVATLLTVGGEPPQIPEPLFEAFRAHFDRDGIQITEEPEPAFRPHDKVQITEGPLQGFPAEVERLDGTNGLRVLVSMFGQIVPARVMAEWAEKVA